MNLIITTISDTNEKYINYLYEYITSLKDNGYNGNVLVLLYGTFKENVYHFLKENKVLVHFKKKSKLINNQRIIDIYNILDTLNYDKILITDIDIWFQDNINLLFNKINNKFIYTSDVPVNEHIIGLAYSNIFKNKNDENISLNKHNDIINDHQTIINCGVFGGRKDVLKNKLNEYIKFSKKTYDVYGLDTVIFNSIYNKDKDIILRYKYNYLTKQNPKLINGIYYTHDNDKIVVMHNAGSVVKENIYSYKKV